VRKSISESSYNKIIKEINEIYYMSSDVAVKERLSKLLDFMNTLSGEKAGMNLEELIANKLAETKSKNPDLNATLYMLYWNLKREKISEEEAVEFFNQLLKSEKFDKLNL
jgi:hypothetical protein